MNHKKEYWLEKEFVNDPKLVIENQKHDLLMEFRCPDRWLIRMSKDKTQFRDWEIKQKLRKVDPKTCQPLTQNKTYLDYLRDTG